MTKISFVRSVWCAVKGIFHGIFRERMLKILFLLGFFAIITSLILRISKTYFITILIMIFLIIILELFNNNFERLIDMISPEYNKQFGEIKDTMAGIVLLMFILMTIVSILILYEPVIKVLKEASNFPTTMILIIVNVVVLLIIIFLYTKNSAKKIKYCSF